MGSVSPSQRLRILIRDGFRCTYCGATKETARLEVDHVIPAAAGGTNDDGNLVAACWACNRGKRDSLLVDVMESDVGVYVKPPTDDSTLAVCAAEKANAIATVPAAGAPLDVALKAAIKKSGLTHYAIGKKAGVVPSVIDRFMADPDEIGRGGDMRISTASRIASALGLDVLPAADATPKRLVTVPEAAWDAERKCECLIAAWQPALRQWWSAVEVLPQSIEINSVGEAFTFAPSFICRGRAGCDIGKEVRVLVVGWCEVAQFTCEQQLNIRNAVISGYGVPTMVLMGPPDFFYGVLVNERYKGTAKGFVVDGHLQPVDEWWSDGWYPDECLDFQDLREPFFYDPKQLALRDFDGDGFVGVYSSIYRKEGKSDGV